MIITKNNSFYVVYVYKEYMNDIDIFDYDSVIIFFKDIVALLKNKFGINGLFCVDVYVNDKYGMIMEFDNYYDNGDEIDIKIKFHIDCIFFNEIDYVDELDKDVYFYDNKFYSFYDEKRDSNIIYKNSLEIVNNGIKIK